MINAAWSYLPCISITLFLGLQNSHHLVMSVFGCRRSFLMSGMSLTRVTKTVSCFTLPKMDWRETTSISTQSALTAIQILLLLSMYYAKKLIELSSRWMMFLTEERFLPYSRFLFWWHRAKSKEQSCRQEHESKEGCFVNVLLWFGLVVWVGSM